MAQSRPTLLLAERLYAGRDATAPTPQAAYPPGYSGAPFVAPPFPPLPCIQDPTNELRALSLLPDAWRACSVPAVGLRALLNDGGGDCVLLAPCGAGEGGGLLDPAAAPLQPIVLPAGSLDKAKLALRLVRYIGAAQRAPWEGWEASPQPGHPPTVTNPYCLVPCPTSVLMAVSYIQPFASTVKGGVQLCALLADSGGAALGSAVAQ